MEILEILGMVLLVPSPGSFNTGELCEVRAAAASSHFTHLFIYLPFASAIYMGAFNLSEENIGKGHK
ncbi:MAG TPA: hypothetical protein PK733_01710 [Clostridiales bacterium]|nr:hypothetical protein [Clostridiales bacterium]